MSAAVYASDPFAYSFEAALEGTTSAEPMPAGKSAEERYWLKRFPDAPTRQQLLQHAEMFGPECVAETAAIYGIELPDLSGKLTTHQRRIKQAHRLHHDRVSTKEIASRMGMSLRTVRKYLSAPDESHVTKPLEVQSRTSLPAGEGAGLSAREEALKERVRALHDVGLVRTAIADRLGKSDRTVGKYLRLIEAEA